MIRTTLLHWSFILIGALLATAFLSSCSKSDPEPIADFTITIISPAPTEPYVKGTVNVIAEASVGTTVASAQFLVDNGLVKELTGSTINIEWDTKTTADGSHTLKIIATDTKGRQSTAQFAIEVLNNFITLSIPSEYIEPGERVIFFLSDDKGNVLSTKEASNDSQLIFETPAGFKPGSSLMLNEFIKESTNAEQINSYTEIKTGTYALKKPSRTNYAGQNKISITDTPTTPDQYIQFGSNSKNTTGTEWVFQTGSAVSINATMASATADVFLWYTDSERKDYSYYLFKDLKIGETASASLNSFTLMNQTEMTSDPTSEFSMTFIDGLTDANNDHSAVRIWSEFSAPGYGDPTKLRLFYPGSLFQKYVFTTVSSVAKFGYKNQYIGTSPPSSFTPISADITSITHEGSIVTYGTSGTCDELMLNAYTTIGNLSVGWGIFVAGGQNKAVNLPKMPIEVKALTTFAYENLVFKSGIITDYDELDGYQAFIQFQLNSPDKLYAPFKEMNPR